MTLDSGIYLKESKHLEGDSVKMHHHQTYQILYVLEDKGKITLDDQEYDVDPDHVALIVPFTEHAIIANSKLTILVLEFEINYLDTGIQEDLVKRHFKQSHLLELNLFEANEIRQLLRKMLYEQSIRKS